eukprot:g5163.t1
MNCKVDDLVGIIAVMDASLLAVVSLPFLFLLLAFCAPSSAMQVQNGEANEAQNQGAARRMAIGQFLFGGALSGAVGVVMLKTHEMSTNSMIFYLRAISSGKKSFQEYSYQGSILAALVDSRAWNRLVLDLHGKVLEYWPK